MHRGRHRRGRGARPSPQDARGRVARIVGAPAPHSVALNPCAYLPFGLPRPLALRQSASPRPTSRQTMAHSSRAAASELLMAVRIRGAAGRSRA